MKAMTEINPPLLADERIDDLQFKGLCIIQSPRAFRFSMDSVLLADFAKARPGMRVCDLGTGTGILPLLLLGRAERITCDALELQPDAAERAERTMRLNGVEDSIRVLCQDLRQVRQALPHAAYDLVICNPPYSAAPASLPSPNPALCAARQEAACTLPDVAAAAAWLLKGRGRGVFMLPAARLSDIYSVLPRFRLEPKRIRFVHSMAERPARLVLMEAQMEVRPGVQIEPPLIVHHPDGSDTEELRRIYHRA